MFARSRGATAAVLPNRQPIQPECAISRVARVNHGDAQIGDSQQAASDCVRMAGTSVYVDSLDEEKRQSRGVSDAADL